MGARGTIQIIDEYDNICHLYTHWDGGQLWEIAVEALRRVKEAGRMNDTPYATRIIFDTMTGRKDSTTGYGIILGDNIPGDVEFDSPVIHFMERGGVQLYARRGIASPVYYTPECTSDDPCDHQGDTCPLHEAWDRRWQGVS